MNAHYRVEMDVGGMRRWLRVDGDRREWTADKTAATTWPTAAEANAVARALKVVAR